MKKSIAKQMGKRWCEMTVELEGGRLSICGSTGEIMATPKAKAEARRYWESFFEENSGEMEAMNKRMGTRYTSPKGAAAFVLREDGPFHGLDVVSVPLPSNGNVFVADAFGQITETLSLFFPEVKPFLRWHLNDMKAECTHQEARGEKWATHPEAVCPDCGYRLGSQWLKRELPPEVLAWFGRLGTDVVAPVPPKVRKPVTPQVAALPGVAPLGLKGSRS